MLQCRALSASLSNDCSLTVGLDSEEQSEEDDEDKGTSRVLRTSASQLRKTPPGNEKTNVKSKLTSMVSGLLSKDRKTLTLKRANSNSGANLNESSENASDTTSPAPSEKNSVYDFDTKDPEDSVSPSFKKYRSPEKQSPGPKKPVKRLSKDGSKLAAESEKDSSAAAPVTRLSTKPKVGETSYYKTHWYLQGTYLIYPSFLCESWRICASQKRRHIRGDRCLQTALFYE